MTVKEFENNFKHLYLPLGMYAMRLVDDADDAEDIVEETFIKAWQIVSDGETIQNFKAFMYRAVRNSCISFLRHRKDNASIEEIPEISEETIDTSEIDAKIWAAIDKLPEKCREIFLMSKRDGLSNEDIAEELGLSINTVKVQMSKAFSRLRDTLSPNHKPFFLPFL